MKAISEGQYIKHSQYGNGVIMQTDTERTTIDFDQHGKKLFVTSLMTVEPAEGTPPKRPSRRRKKAASTTSR